jgi:hypothetical protein
MFSVEDRVKAAPLIAGALAGLWLLSQSQDSGSPDAPPNPPDGGGLGGDDGSGLTIGGGGQNDWSMLINDDDVNYLARELVSESGSNQAVWPAIAQTTANHAAKAGLSISALLQRGVKSGHTLYNLGPGPQFDKSTGIVRFASTRQGSTAASLDFARRFIGGGLTADEQATADSVRGASSFLERSGMSGSDPKWTSGSNFITGFAGWEFYT